MNPQLPLALAVFAILTEPGYVRAQSAQPSPPESGQPPVPRAAFERLSPGDRIVARALHADQLASPRAVDAGLLSLEEIARRRERGRGWGEIFSRMKDVGLLRAHTLGQAVSRHHRQSPAYAPAFTGAPRPARSSDLVGPEKAASIRPSDAGVPRHPITRQAACTVSGTAPANVKKHLAGGLETPPGSPGASIDPGAVPPGIHFIDCSEGRTP